MIKSLKNRITLAAALLLLLCFGLVVIAVSNTFVKTLEKAAKEQLETNANLTLIAAASLKGNKLVMPDQLPDPKFNNPDSNMLGYIYDPAGKLIWRSHSSERYPEPKFDPNGEPGIGVITFYGNEYLVYDSDIQLDKNQYYSFVTMVPAERYNGIVNEFEHGLLLWMILLSWCIVSAFWLSIWWALRPVRKVSTQLSLVENGQQSLLEGHYPAEISRLTSSINTLLQSEQKQRERYRNSMADLAHSLKTPLVILQSISHTLEMDGDRMTKEEVGELRRSLNGQIKSMNQMLSYHLQRTAIGSKGLVRKQVLVAPIINDLNQTLQKVYFEKRVKFQLEEQYSAAVFNGDEQDLLEMLGNLLENAFKFCHQRIEVTLTKSNQNILNVIIADDGPGIAPEYRDVILQRGVRADCRTSGQGIGLAMVMEIIENYQGSLEITESDLGGCQFNIMLPG